MSEEYIVTGAALVLESVLSLAGNAIEAGWDAWKELSKLQDYLVTLQIVVEDAEERQEVDELVKLCLRELKNLAYDAEDILCEANTQALAGESGVQRKVRNFFSVQNPSSHAIELARKIRPINEKLEEKKSELDFLLDREIPTEILSSENLDQQRREKNTFVGRESDKSKIIHMLIDDEHGLSVLPVLGRGGLGKTALAQLVYNDDSIKEHFELRIWISVSSVDFDALWILKDIVESIANCRYEISSMDTITSIFQKEVTGKRFLLVLDDVWNEDNDKWCTLKEVLLSASHGTNGCKIVVTTRSDRVASLMGTCSAYKLSILSEEDSWSLFESLAFSNETKKNSDFVNIGKSIVKNCGGLPLAIKVLGSLLYYKETISEWQSILNTSMRATNGDVSFPELTVSYNLLSPHLRRCFQYCALFPDDYTIDKKKIIQMWMAEGLLGSSRPLGNQTWEDIGEEYFNTLKSYSFFRDVKEDEITGMLTCKMHNYMREFALSISPEVSHVDNDFSTNEVFDELLYVSISRSEIPEVLVQETKILRTFIDVSYKDFDCQILKLQYLRVLDIGSAWIEELPSSIHKLKHLRYLGLSSDRIKVLPNSITRLCNLQTLRLDNCSQLEGLPKDIRNLVNLRHLEIGKCPHLTVFPRDIKQLKFLRTLPIYKIGKDRGNGIDQLEGLDITGELKIENLQNVKDTIEVEKACLAQKSNLHTLKLCWVQGNKDSSEAKDQIPVLEGLQPHSNLKVLEINNFMGDKFPQWMNACAVHLPFLVKLFLYRCNKCKHLPPLGRLSRLKVLLISSMDGVSSIGKDFYGLPNDDSSNQHQGEGEVMSEAPFCSLEELTLWNMQNLREWAGVESPSFSSCFPSLRKLDVNGSPMLRITPTSFPALKELLLCTSTNKALTSITVKLDSLTSLQIYGIPDMEFMPPGLLQKNEHLQRIDIRSCPMLRALLPVEQPQSQSQSLCSSLKELSVGGYVEDLNHFPAEGIQHLVSLLELEISGWPNLKSLPRQLEHLTKLQHLTIRSCDGLEALPDWLVSLSSLRSLMIFDCENLKCPPEGMPYPPKLTRLEIEDCEHLLERLVKLRNNEQSEIARIPYVHLD